MNTQTQIQTPQQIDKRAVIAIARAVEKRRSYVLWYGDIYDELRSLIEDDEEFHRVENRLYEDIVDGRIRNVYRFWGTCDDSECDIIVVSPIVLNENQLKMLRELSRLYSFKRYDGNEEREELTLVLHNLIKMWSSSCLKISGPAEAVYELAKNYGLEIKEEEYLDRWYAGNIYYTVEGLDDNRIVKTLWYCNDCVDFSTGNSFIEKCKSWRFEDDEE
jgi:hypothetical protein